VVADPACPKEEGQSSPPWLCRCVRKGGDPAALAGEKKNFAGRRDRMLQRQKGSSDEGVDSILEGEKKRLGGGHVDQKRIKERRQHIKGWKARGGEKLGAHHYFRLRGKKNGGATANKKPFFYPGGKVVAMQ